MPHDARVPNTKIYDVPGLAVHRRCRLSGFNSQPTGAENRTGDGFGLARLRNRVYSRSDTHGHGYDVTGLVYGEQHAGPYCRCNVKQHEGVASAEGGGSVQAAVHERKQRREGEWREQLAVRVVGADGDQTFAEVEEALGDAHKVEAGRVLVVVAAQVA
jgi:hypothetical protein